MLAVERARNIRQTGKEQEQNMQQAIESAVLMRQQMFHLSKTLTQTKQGAEIRKNRGHEINKGEKREETYMLRHTVQYRQEAGKRFHLLYIF